MDFSKVNLYIATPCYGGQVFVNYFSSMLKLVSDLKGLGINSTVKPIGNESLITRARNCLFSDFLDSEDNFTHLLFIDADIGFRTEHVLKLLKNDRDIVGGTYPHKHVFWDTFSSIIKKKGVDILNDVRKLESISNNYSVDLVYSKNSDNTSTIIADPENKLLKAHYIPTGFMMIKREVGEKMKIVYNTDYYINDNAGYGNYGKQIWNFFNCFVCKKSQRYLSEDYAFCRRWEDLGGEIWLDYSIELTHCGTYLFKGSYGEKLDYKIR